MAIADASQWEGQNVRLEGWVEGVRTEPDGVLRFQLADSGTAIAVRAAGGTDDVSNGDRLAAAGRLSRSAGALVLLVEAGNDLRVVQEPAAEHPTWPQVGESPQEWTGRRIVLAGAVQQGRLVGDGVSISLGEGPWPKDGAKVEATGLLRYERDCVCHAFDASEVRPWTSLS